MAEVAPEDALHSSGGLPLVPVARRGYGEMDTASAPSGCSACRATLKQIMEVPNSSAVAVAVQSFIIAVICLATLSVIIETVPGMEDYRWSFSLLENVVTVLFTGEILLRYWVSDSCCAYATVCYNVIDIIATLPGYVEWFLESQRIDPFWRIRNEHIDPVWSVEMLRMLQVIRLARILRMAKAARHSEVVATVMQSFYASLTGLSALVVFVGSTTVLSATVVFFTEAVDKDTQFVSIPAALWYSLATITGVGYGDMVPSTPAGKGAGSVTMILGVLAISMSVAIITTAFMEQYRRSVALMKLERVGVRRGAPMRGSSSEERLSAAMADASKATELSPLSQPRPGRSSFLIDVNENNLLATLITIEDSMKEILMRLEATAIRAQGPRRSMVDNGIDPAKPSGFVTPSPIGRRTSWVPEAMSPLTGVQTALTLLREQNEAWFKHATLLAEQILESDATAQHAEE